MSLVEMIAKGTASKWSQVLSGIPSNPYTPVALFCIDRN